MMDPVKLGKGELPEKPPQAPEHAKDLPPGKQLGRKGHGDVPSGHQADCDPTMRPRSYENNTDNYYE